MIENEQRRTRTKKEKNSKTSFQLFLFSFSFLSSSSSSQVKALFSRLNVPATVVEIDTLADADDVSAALAEATGRRTVPQVFVGGTHVGGCDDTVAADKSGKLRELLGAVGVKV